MDFENILYRILLGYYFININNKVFKVQSPTLSLRYGAHRYYLDLLEKYKFDNTSLLSNTTKDQLLIITNIWNSGHEIELNELNKSLDNSKIELYKNFNNPKLKKQIKKIISGINYNISKFLSKKHYLDFLTLEFFCGSMKNQYILINSIYDNNNLAFNDIDNIESQLLENILYEIYNNQIPMENIKNFARSDLWRSYWDSKKDNIFNHSFDLTDDQRMLINISKLLDNIREHPECPNNEIINDNDALDGWMLFQHQKNKAEKVNNDLDNKKRSGPSSKKHSNLEEVFFIASNQEETHEILSMNNDQINEDISNIHRTIKEKESMTWHEVPFVSRQIESVKS